MWKWLNADEYGWGFFARVVLKAAFLFALCNLIYMLTTPLPWISRLSAYPLTEPRSRLPYSEQPAQSFSLTTTNLDAMFASHAVTRPKAPDEFRVLLVGDSATWGWLLEPSETYAAHLNRADLRVNGRRVRAYNLGYPVMSLTKDLLISDYAKKYNADLVVWLVSLESFPPSKQTFPPIVRENPAALRPLIDAYDLSIDPAALDAPPTRWEQTLVGQRQPLADWARLQLYSPGWALTGRDQVIPIDYEPTRSDFPDENVLTFEDYTEPTTLTRDDLAFDVLAAGIQNTNAPVILVNEPIFISDGQNSDLRYNSLYPRWAYDQYRDLLAGVANENGWFYADLWDTIPPDEFTDSPVHLTPAGAQQLAAQLEILIADITEE